MTKKRRSTPNRRPRQKKELQDAAKHIGYEIRMLARSSRFLPYGFSSPAEDDTANMALESFLLHFRNLRALLCPGLQRTGDNDVVASDFWGAAKARNVGDRKVLGRRRRKIDRMLAHISYSRQWYVSRRADTWPIDTILGDMGTAIRKFLGRLSQEQRSWVLQETAGAEQEIFEWAARLSTSRDYTSTVTTTHVLLPPGHPRKRRS